MLDEACLFSRAQETWRPRGSKQRSGIVSITLKAQCCWMLGWAARCWTRESMEGLPTSSVRSSAFRNFPWAWSTTPKLPVHLAKAPAECMDASSRPEADRNNCQTCDWSHEPSWEWLPGNGRQPSDPCATQSTAWYRQHLDTRNETWRRMWATWGQSKTKCHLFLNAVTSTFEGALPKSPSSQSGAVQGGRDGQHGQIPIKQVQDCKAADVRR